MLTLKILDRSLCLLQVYAPTATNEYQAFVDEVIDVFLLVLRIEFTVLMGRRVARNSQWGGAVGGLGAEPPALENFAFFCKNNFILGLF